MEVDGEVIYRADQSDPCCAMWARWGSTSCMWLIGCRENFWAGPHWDCARWQWRSRRPRSRSAEIALRDPAVPTHHREGRCAEPVTVDAQTGSSSNSDYTRGGPRIPRRTRRPRRRSRSMSCGCRTSATFVDESIDQLWPPALRISAARSKGLSSRQVAKADVALSGKGGRGGAAEDPGPDQSAE